MVEFGLKFGIIVFLNSVLFLIISGNETAWKAMDKPCLCKEFRCNNGSICLGAERVCDGALDCPGGEDEKIEVNKVMKPCRRGFKANCTAEEFKCKFGDCVKLTQVCDGQINCWGGVDEAIDFCTWVNSRK